MTTQLEFIDYRPVADNDDVRRWVALVNARRGWITAAECCELMGPTWNGDDRVIRAFAEQASGSVISGRKGYKHIQWATTEEINHFCNQMESQARRMIERAVRTRQLAHQRVG